MIVCVGGKGGWLPCLDPPVCCLAHYHSLLAQWQAEAEEMWLLDSEDAERETLFSAVR